MIKLWFVPEILVCVRELSLKFEFGGRHACLNCYFQFQHRSTSGLRCYAQPFIFTRTKEHLNKHGSVVTQRAHSGART